ncbi:hypothetical protein PybrP1_005344 [[Pythium] brassicae (nom. inval.)]|nr:hypothetical protein PybrP1_005344 [[Pythium] brassicae (nom. inval.)]
MSFTLLDADLSARSELLAAPSKDLQPLLLAGDSVHDFELSFLDEFLEQGELVPEPQSPALSDMAPVTNASAASSPLTVEPRLQLMPTDADFGLGKSGAVDFEAVAAAAEAQLAMVMRTVGNRAQPARSSSSGDEEESGPIEPLDRKARRRVQVAISARRHRSRKKHEMIDLRKEATYLNAQLDFLRSRHKLMRPNGAVAESEERAVALRRKRRQAEELNEELRRAVFMQGVYISNFKALFHSAAMTPLELNMRQLLHTYTRLGMSPQARLRDYDAICTDAKVDLAIKLVTRETAALDVLTPSISVRHVRPNKHEFGATIVAAYAFDTLDIRQIFIAACAAIRDSGREWPEYVPVETDVKVVAAPRDNMRYGVARIRYRSEVDSSEEVVVESRSISYYRVTDSYGVLVWDFVDDDDLFPLEPETTMQRNVIGASLVRRELCADGVERVVVRSLCTKIHAFDLPMPSTSIVRFAQSTDSGSDVCGLIVYNSIRNEFQRHLAVA